MFCHRCTFCRLCDCLKVVLLKWNEVAKSSSKIYRAPPYYGKMASMWCECHDETQNADRQHAREIWFMVCFEVLKNVLQNSCVLCCVTTFQHQTTFLVLPCSICRSCLFHIFIANFYFIFVYMLSICSYQFICNLLRPSRIWWDGEGNERRTIKASWIGSTLAYHKPDTHFNNFYILYFHQCNFGDEMRDMWREREKVDR